MIKQQLFNPFLRVAGFRSLGLGIMAMMLTGFVAFYSKCHFDGVLDAHVGAATSLWLCAAEPLIDWLCITLCLYLGGIIFSKSAVRFVDVAGTMALARWPMFFVALLAFISVLQPGVTTPSPFILGVALLLVLLFSIWMVILMYNAFVISCNIKGAKGTSVFIASLILAEIISKLIIIQIVSDSPSF